MKILVTGGAGYIGSVTVNNLLRKGHEVVVFDNLVYGHKESVPCRLMKGDLLDKDLLYKSFNGQNFDAVMHFASLSLAGESMHFPFKYFQNNIVGGLNLLDVMRENGVRLLIFSSTCSIYGIPKNLPVDESSEKDPESVYGDSKLMLEKIIDWYDRIYNIKYITLRYFNAAGASIDGKLGEDHDPETHIIPVAIKCVLEGKPFSLFGRDYNTPDGTCIRDYVHVEDLASAHILALEKLIEKNQSNSFNVGSGKGYSNLEVLEIVRKVSGVNFSINVFPRRMGDPPIIFADNKKIMDELGFKAQFSDLEIIVKSAWEWHKRNQKLNPN